MIAFIQGINEPQAKFLGSLNSQKSWNNRTLERKGQRKGQQERVPFKQAWKPKPQHFLSPK